MKLLYLYVKDHRCFKDQEFNFDSTLRFHLNHNNDNYSLECKRDDSFPNNFFSSEKDKETIYSISAIIGNNGSGKTSIIKLLDDLMTRTNHMFEHIIIYEIESPDKQGKRIVCRYNLFKKVTSELLWRHFSKNENSLEPHLNAFQEVLFKEYMPNENGGGKKIEDLDEKDFIYQQAYLFFTLDSIGNDKKDNVLADELSCTLTCNNKEIEIIRWDPNLNHMSNDFILIYYSPLYTTEFSLQSGVVRDISTTHCLTSGSGSRCEHYQNSSNQIMILPDKAHRAYEYMWTLKFLSALRRKGLSFSDFEIRKPIGITISPENVLLRLSMETLYSLQERYKKEDLSYKEITDVITGIKTNDFFVKTFVCFFASYCRDHLRGAVAVSRKLEDDENIFDVVREYLETLKAIEAKMPSDQSPKNMSILYEMILDVLKKHDKNTYSLFVSLKKLYDYNMNKRHNLMTLSSVNCPCFEDEWLAWTLDFIETYFQSFTITNFLSISFDPNYSSGEMSFISMFARLYELFPDKSNLPIDEIICFLDEAETALHPQWQLELVYLQIRFWEIFYPKSKVHLIFASHSPILLSDIPLNNVVFLERANNSRNATVVSNTFPTFGGNVFDMYQHSFFLKNGFIGIFSKHIIDSLLNVVNNEPGNDIETAMTTNRELFNSYAKLIGDRNIREYLLSKYAENLCQNNNERIQQYRLIIETLESEKKND